MMRGILIGVLVLALTSCEFDALINETQNIESGQWEFSDTKSFSLEVSDDLTPNDHYLLVRHGGNYAYQNLILYVKTFYPNNTYKVDTVDCPLSDGAGKWYGSGLGDLLDNRIMFKRNEQFDQTGTYNFELQHAMRADTVMEIYDVGIMISPSSK